MTTLSTHVLDTAAGRPASGIAVTVAVLDGEDWLEVGSGVTDDGGRIGHLADGLASGTYRLVFDVGESHFYPSIQLLVRLEGAEPHYHLPVLLSPYGYTTYRGS